jgi:hypothetical protein
MDTMPAVRTAMAEDPHKVADILDRLEECARSEERVSIGDVVGTFGSRSYGPFLLVPALTEISPLGGIPGLPTAIAAVIILFAAQIAFGRAHIWLPGFIAKRSLSSDRLKKAVRKLRPIGRWTDRWFHGRLPTLTSGPFVRFAAAACILLALTVPPLELLPFATTAPMAAIAAFGLAMLVRDGALMIVALLLAAGSVGLGGYLLATKVLG